MFCAIPADADTAAITASIEKRVAERYGVPAHEILQRVGKAGYVGGQEDMIIDVALRLVAERDQAEG